MSFVPPSSSATATTSPPRVVARSSSSSSSSTPSAAAAAHLTSDVRRRLRVEMPAPTTHHHRPHPYHHFQQQQQSPTLQRVSLSSGHLREYAGGERQHLHHHHQQQHRRNSDSARLAAEAVAAMREGLRLIDEGGRTHPHHHHHHHHHKAPTGAGAILPAKAVTAPAAASSSSGSNSLSSAAGVAAGPLPLTIGMGMLRTTSAGSLPSLLARTGAKRQLSATTTSPASPAYPRSRAAFASSSGDDNGKAGTAAAVPATESGGRGPSHKKQELEGDLPLSTSGSGGGGRRAATASPTVPQTPFLGAGLGFNVGIYAASAASIASGSNGGGGSGATATATARRGRSCSDLTGGSAGAFFPPSVSAAAAAPFAFLSSSSLSAAAAAAASKMARFGYLATAPPPAPATTTVPVVVAEAEALASSGGAMEGVAIPSSPPSGDCRRRRCRRCGAATAKGKKPGKPRWENQDSTIALDLEDPPPAATAEAAMVVEGLYAAMDGHGDNGHLVSRHCRARLPHLLAEANYDPHRAYPAMQEDLKAAFGDAIASSGSTCVLALLHRTPSPSGGNGPLRLTVANLGDSRCVLGRRLVDEEEEEEEEDNGGVLLRAARSSSSSSSSSSDILALPLSDDHKPDRQDELRRIVAAGGRVGCRQYVVNGHAAGHGHGHSRSASAPAFTVQLGPPRLWYPVGSKGEMTGLAMSRSLGDVAAHSAGGSCEPEVVERVVRPGDAFLILATDGLWDVVGNQLAVELVESVAGRGRGKGKGETGAAGGEWDPQEAAELLVRCARQRWEALSPEVIDDISAVVVKLEGY